MRFPSRPVFLLAFPFLCGVGACSGTLATTDDLVQPIPGHDDTEPAEGGAVAPTSDAAAAIDAADASPAPACAEADKICKIDFNFTPPSALGTVQSVELRGDWAGAASWQAGVAMTQSGGCWTAQLPLGVGKRVQYKYVVNGGTWTVDPSAPTSTDPNGNVNNVIANVTCPTPSCPFTPDGGGGSDGGAPQVFDWRDAVLYFVFVDRFSDGDTSLNAACNIPGVSGGAGSIANYQGGDWAGVTQKINQGYFTSLGVNALWLTVPVRNVNVGGYGIGGDQNNYSAYHGYWPVDVTQPEECFGSLADLKALVSAAHAKGIKVLFDYAMVHVHQSAAIYAQNPSWFWPNDNNRGGDCICGQGCSWDNLPDRERCWFTGYLPHWNYTNAAARAYSVNAAVQWVTSTGVDGFRLDAIKHVDISWLTQLRSQIDTQILAQKNPKPRFYMVGETYDFGNRQVIKDYVDPSTKLDGQFDFPLRKNVVEAVVTRQVPMNALDGFMASNDGFYGPDAIMSTWIGNHDLPRIIHFAENNRAWNDQAANGKERAWYNQPGLPAETEAFERVANGFAVLMTNPGVPLIYYGDEIGMPGAGDPDNRRFMQWTGLSANQTWLRDRVSKLTSIRAAHPALRRGSRLTTWVDADGWVYERTFGTDTVYVAINRADYAKPVGGLPAGALQELVTGAATSGPGFTIPPRQTRIFVK